MYMRKNRNYWDLKKSKDVAINFTNKRDFKSEYPAAYEFLRKNKLLDMVCTHMSKPDNPNKKWTKESCYYEALKYKTLRDYRKGSERSYRIARDSNWLEEIGLHFEKNNKRKEKWTFDKCKEEALKYSYRIDFIKNSKNIYAVCVRKKWLNEVCSHMKDKYSNKIKWTFDKCKEEALKFKSRKEFQNKSKKIYAAAQYNGWINQICSHMDYKQKPNYYWNDINNCRLEALKYKTKTEFIRGSSYCYSMSLKNGWLSEICSHMINIGDRYNKCVYVYEFSDNHAYVGLTYNMDLRIKNRKRSKSDAVTIHINNTRLQPQIKKMTEYIPVDKAIELENHYFQLYKNNGWIMLNRSRTGGIGSTTSKWNYISAKKISKQYPTITEFEDKEKKLYEISKRSGWLESFYK